MGTKSEVMTAQTILLALLDPGDMILSSLCTLHHAVDQPCGWDRGSVGGVCIAMVQCKGRVVVPVRQRHWAKILVVVGRRWAVNNDWAYHTIPVLRRKVRMVPAGAELSAPEAILLGLARSNGTFGDAVASVLLVGVKLSDSMEVHRCAMHLEIPSGASVVLVISRL
ncbi:hypothetical protein KC368_g13 [Hortaea werneckii]|nr:hypothetical protein KC368_g13 [Hortaea werneckii]